MRYQQTKFEKLDKQQQQLVIEVYNANPPKTIMEVGSLLQPISEFIKFDWPNGATVINGASRSTPIATATPYAISELKRMGLI